MIIFTLPLPLTSWDALYGAWPTVIVLDLNKILPPSYGASPRIHLGAAFEIDVATSRRKTDLPDQDEYEVRVYEAERRRLVAAVEIVSPADRDRPGGRRAFVAKCAALLQQGVSVSIVDLVTTRRANLYGDLLALLGQAGPALGANPIPLYAAACRRRQNGVAWRFEAWAHALQIDRPLPTLPLWLAPDFAVPLELESTCEESCRILRIAV